MRDMRYRRAGWDAGRRPVRHCRAGAASVLALVLLAGCRERKTDTAQPGTAATSRIREVAERAIRTAGAAGAAMQFRGVQVYDQAAPGRWAVCGQVAPFADDANLFVPFVSVVGLRAGLATAYRIEQHVGTSTAEADHVYMALVENCYEKGGPMPGPFRSIAPLPPLPDTVPDPSRRPGVAPHPANAAAGAPGPPSVAADAAGASDRVPAAGSVAMRQNANIRAAPHGAPVRVVPQGTVLHVFATAPGGWNQVGDTAPWGWVHDSMVDRR